MFRIPTKIKVDNPELLFVIYYWGFILLRPFLQAFETKSSVILFVFVLALFSFFLVGMILRKEAKIGKAVFLVVIFFLFFLLDSVFRHTIFSNEYIYKFVYSGIIPVLFLSKIRDALKTLKYFTWFSLFAFFLFGADPLSGYKVFTDYMDYGFSLAMPAFFGIFLGYHFFKIRCMLIFEILCFFCILLFANRSSLLSALSFMTLYFIFMSPDRKRIMIRWVLPISILIVIISLNIEPITKFIYQIVTINFGYNSRSLNNFMAYFVKSNDFIVYSGRIEIWTKANNMINENIFLGHGMGAFQQRYGDYSHNIYFDILLFYGIIGLLVFSILVFYSIFRILKSNVSARILGFLFFSLWFPKLFFSSYFIKDIGFWCFLSFPFLIKYINQRKSNVQYIDH
jgi:hypothetical protein